MKTICFYFQIHQPFRLKRYRFFDIGSDNYYYDDFNNEAILERIAKNSFLPANNTLLEMIKSSKGKFKAAFSISGVALEQLEMQAPEVIDSFKKLAATNCVEFLSETYAHSLCSLNDVDEFRSQVEMHSNKIQSLFGQKPKVFRNTELIYSDEIGSMVYDMGYKTIITEGAKQVLGWKSPNFVYHHAGIPKLKLLLKNSKLSDDISFRFTNYSWSEYPLTADKFIDWISQIPENENIVNLFMNYETFGNLQPAESGIFDFLKALPYQAEQRRISFSTPGEISDKIKPIESLSVHYPISWADEERDISAWLGNVLQKEAFSKLYSLSEKIRLIKDRKILKDWQYLQTSDHFFYMSTKRASDGAVHKHFSPFDSPFEAFTNYMNVLSDFIQRVTSQFPEGLDIEELNSLLKTIENQEETISHLEAEIKTLKSRKAKTIN